MDIPFLTKHKTMEELRDENDKAELELSLEQKRTAIKRLKAAGLTPNNFGGNWSRIVKWLKGH